MNGNGNGQNGKRRSMVDKMREHPLIATLIVLLPVLVAAYVQLVTGLSDVKDEAAELEKQAAELEEKKAGIVDKAGDLEQATIKTSRELAQELEGLRKAAVAELAAIYSAQADARESLDLLRERIALVEDSCLDEETLLRTRAKREFPGANVDGMEASVLRRLLGIVVPGSEPDTGAAAIMDERDKPPAKAEGAGFPAALAEPIELPPQAPVF